MTEKNARLPFDMQSPNDITPSGGKSDYLKKIDELSFISEETRSKLADVMEHGTVIGGAVRGKTSLLLSSLYDKYGEALVFMGAAGPSSDWINGIHNLLFAEGITHDKNSDTFWQHVETLPVRPGRTDLVLHFDPAAVDIGRLAIWRVQNRGRFDVMWLSDYIDNGCESDE